MLHLQLQFQGLIFPRRLRTRRVMSNNFNRSPQRSNNRYVPKPNTRSLPANWEVHISQNVEKNRPYYFNVITAESVWNFPTTRPQQPPQPSVRFISDDEKIVLRLIHTYTRGDEQTNIFRTYINYKKNRLDNITAFSSSLKGSSLSVDEQENILLQFISDDKS